MNTNHMSKLAYAYSSLRTKTARPFRVRSSSSSNTAPAPLSNEEKWYKLQLDKENEPGYLSTKGKELTDYLRDKENFGEIAAGTGVGLGALGLGTALGASSASDARARLRGEGFSEEEMDDVLTTGGSIGRTMGNAALYGGAGALGGYGIGNVLERALIPNANLHPHHMSEALGAVGGLVGAGYGAYKSRQGDSERADKAISEKKMKKLERAAKKKTKKKRTKKAALHAVSGILGQIEARRLMEDAGMDATQMSDVSTLGGGALRGLGKGLGYQVGGALGAGLLGQAVGGNEGAVVGSALGNLGGLGYGLYRGYQGEIERAQEAVDALKKKK